MSKSSFPVAVAITLSLLGLFEVVLRCIYIPAPHSWTLGLLEAAQDPGKSLFHVIVLPSAIYLLLRYLQEIDISQAFQMPLKKRLNILIIVLLSMVPPIYGYQDTLKQFYHAAPMPWDFSDQTLAKELMNIRVASLETIAKNIVAGHAQSDVEYKKYDAALLNYFGSKDKSFSEYWELSSFRKKYADFLSVLGLFGACMLLGSVAISGGIRNRIEAGFIDKLLLAYGALATWIPMRMYSDWHGGMGNPEISNDGIVIAAVLLVVIGALFIIFQKPTFRVGVTATGITLLATIVGGVGAIKPEWFIKIAGVFYTAPTFILFSIYVTIVVSFSGLIVYIAENEETNKRR
ncbi:hypothetical protein [Nitrincola nitratireducens]|uniref:Uncharacterized protein n=1 Tax=Nitrincola nitratireducens TaxID=1229521 RepID=W9V2T5_9GAMM|nr:hypothetical protein [Nitrincola nitratireducens]EXJ11256.1 hypothetical protein D791_01711 [Nitrincola nitratireducens]